MAFKRKRFKLKKRTSKKLAKRGFRVKRKNSLGTLKRGGYRL